MPTTVRQAVVGLAEIATAQLLAPRRDVLKHRAPRSRYVHQLRRDVDGGRARPLYMTMDILLADAEDGVAYEILAQPLLTILAGVKHACEARASRRGFLSLADAPRSDDVVLTLTQRETAAQAALDQAQLVALADPTPEKERAVIDAKARYDAEANRLVACLRERSVRGTLALLSTD